MPAPMERRGGGKTFALLSAVFYATRPGFVRFALDAGAGVPELFALRMVFGSFVFFVAGLVKGEREPAAPGLWRNPRMLIGAGCFSVAVMSSFYAVSLIGVSLTAVIVFTHPTFVALFSRIIRGERLGKVRALSMATSYAGAVLLVAPAVETEGTTMLVGGALALLTAAAYASYQLITQEVARTAPTFRIAAATAHLSVLPSLLFWHFDPPTVSLTTVGVGAALGFFSTFLPLIFLVAAIERIGAVTASMFSVIGPVVAVVIGWLFFNETLAWSQAAGAALLIGSVFLLVFNRVRSA